MPVAPSSLRQRLYRILFDQSTRSGRRVEALCGFFALFSVVIIFVESALDSHYHLTFDQWHTFVYLELLITAVFTAEYFLRVLCWSQPAKYVFSFWGIIDLITVLPMYVLWLWPEISVNYVFAWRALRTIRILRVLKLLRYMSSLRIFWLAIVSARHQLMVFYFLIAIVMVVFGSLMYGIEGPENGFVTLGASVYWAVVTATTVGYGDIAPHTGVGRFVASLLILIGYSVIAIPTGLITTHMSNEYQNRRSTRICPKCRHTGHEKNANYCSTCGTSLPEGK
ncbi:ion transporter [Scandinavium manionii]|uniref:ion transporter n=1 Tax=Scandinavium manionii TaxID=2926520 RepID=UPI0021659768|nr:ion transporter [Scandinavium manionii]MCS2167813.1 ion transporter [Scandinavium manionii]